ncbi:hypothetical protein [Bacillus norwichensis]|uniref:Uncharacterized protein n=1 Tax=Bacillus norwichensis TaxID=2762217 RepID=A0ABR8VNV0_9BACI|nr:hypothetical protein [Bacillus norwichensis]MBD8006435.1 hypothetical protein [Bacillus norwichensis]
MEKTFYIATQAFGWFISISLAVFVVFAFKLKYPFIGTLLILIFLASCVVNFLFRKKWKETL